MSATSTTTTTKTTANVTSRAVTYITAAALQLCLHTTHERGVPSGELTEDFETIERGLRVWFTLRQLASVVLEFFDKAGTFVEAIEFPIVYETRPGSAEHFDVQVDQLRAELGKLPPSRAKSYKVVVTFTVEDRMPVRGWAKTKRNDVSKLRKIKLGGKVASTAAISMDAYAFTGGTDE